MSPSRPNCLPQLPSHRSGVDVEDVDTIYAAANGQVFQSSDGGATFIAVDDAS